MKINSFNKVIVLVSILFCSFAQANLIVNGSFEDTDVANNHWLWYPSAADAGWDGSNIEIWENFLGVQSTHGDQFAELNSHRSNDPAFSIFQSFNTNIGFSYDYSFAYRARRNDNEAFNVEIFSQLVGGTPLLIDDHTTQGWSLFKGSFIANAQISKIMFTSVYPKTGTVGNFLDNISVTVSARQNNITVPVPEPSAVLLMALAILFLVRVKR